MIMRSDLRRAVLTLHLVASLGWIGALGAYLVLDVTTATSEDVTTLRAAYISMEAITWWAIVPLAYVSFLSGVAMALGTRWGLFRHWWVVMSLMLTAFAILVLMVETRTIDLLAGTAADPAASDPEVRALPSTLLHSVLGMALLFFITALNIYKPRGLTPYGWRKQQETAVRRDDP